MAKIVMLIIALVYLDFAVWYSAQMHNIWNAKTRKYRGVLVWIWDWLGR